jgi:hypothetical protein
MDMISLNIYLFSRQGFTRAGDVTVMIREVLLGVYRRSFLLLLAVVSSLVIGNFCGLSTFDSCFSQVDAGLPFCRHGQLSFNPLPARLGVL